MAASPLDRSSFFAFPSSAFGGSGRDSGCPFASISGALFDVDAVALELEGRDWRGIVEIMKSGMTGGWWVSFVRIVVRLSLMFDVYVVS